MQSLVSSDIGGDNATFIINYLNNESIPIVSSDLGGIYPRKIYFFPQTGKVMVRKLTNIHNVEEQEENYFSRVSMLDIEGEIELFE